jgi:arylsulfatase A-like enzyme
MLGLIALGRAPRRALILGVAVVVLVSACAPDESPAQLVLRPGDGLLDLLPWATFAVEPGSGLPPTFGAAARDRFVLRTPVLPRSAWTPVANPPPLWQELLAKHGSPPVWRAELPAVRDGETRPLRVFVQGVEPQPWDPGSGDPPPAGFVWWEHSLKLILSVGGEAPEGVAVDLHVDPLAELGPLARLDPSPLGHLGRRELGTVTRPSLLMPPPGVIEWRVAELQAERLHVSLGLLDRAWAFFDDAFHRTLGLSDGATFAVEVNGERVFERTLAADAVGGEWVDDVVDLSSFTGQPVTLRLVSEAGVAGDPVFDWALWGDLRLRGGAKAAPERPHVVLIHVDTLRADRVGGPDSRTPMIDAWAAAHAVVFEDAQAPAPWTLPSSVTMLSGLAVHQHGAERSTHSVGPGARLLSERLAELGYEGHGLAAGGYLRPQFGFDRGFDRYEVDRPKTLDFTPVTDALPGRSGSHPLFLFAHTYHVHAPYAFDAEWASPGYDGPFAGQDVDYPNVIDPYRRGELALTAADLAYMESLYDAHVRRMDRAVGALLQQLERSLGPEGLMLILTSDHGEGFGEHEQIEHGDGLWNEQLHVPLLVRFPDGAPGRRDDPVALQDIVPTVLDVLGLPADELLPGRSLRGELPEDRVRTARNVQKTLQRAVQVSGYKLLRERAHLADAEEQAWLFDLGADPGERQDLSADEPRIVESLARSLEVFEEEHPAPRAASVGGGELSQEIRAQLRALGYLGDG